MFHLVYASRAVSQLSGEDLLAQLPVYRDKNLRLGVTGLLLYRCGEFMQALEGEEAAVRALFATIQKDPRHEQVHLLLNVSVPKRQFPSWSMGFRNLEDVAEGETIPGFTPYPDFPPPRDRGSWKGSIGVGMLAAFMHEY